MGFFGNELLIKDVNQNTTKEINNPKEKLLEKVCFFYGYPHNINNYNDPIKAAEFFAKYDVIVWGNGRYDPSRSNYSKTVETARHLKKINKNIKLFGYIPIGMEDGDRGERLPIFEIERRADLWKTLGATGIFYDEFGFDYKVTRERQNNCIQIARDRGMNVFANAWEQKYVFSTTSMPLPWLQGFDGNPDQIPSLLGENDYTLFEEITLSYDYEEIDTQKIYTQKVKKSRLNSVKEYVSTPRPEIGNKTWKEHYKTKAIGLDSIVIEDKQMHDDGFIYCLASGLDGYAPSIASWGSSSSNTMYYDYDEPSLGISSRKEIGKPEFSNFKGFESGKLINTFGKNIVEIICNHPENFNYYENSPSDSIFSIIINKKGATKGPSWKKPLDPEIGSQFFDIIKKEFYIYKGDSQWGTVSSKEFLIEIRESDPENPEPGRIWMVE